jgi:uncharacterized membrane protein YsdA (DUF1294 family)
MEFSMKFFQFLVVICLVFAIADPSPALAKGDKHPRKRAPIPGQIAGLVLYGAAGAWAVRRIKHKTAAPSFNS